MPLTDEEISAVDDGVFAYEKLINKLADASNPSGSTTREILANINDDIAEALSHHATSLAEKLRKRNLVTPYISLFCRTSPFRAETYYVGTRSVGFNVPTNDRQTLIKATLTGLKQCFKQGYLYRAAGIQAFHLQSVQAPRQSCIPDVILNIDVNMKPTSPIIENPSLNRAIDTLNQQFGRHTVFWASSGIKPKYQVRQNMRTHRYTTRWNELVHVACE